ncbi:MAG TPA: hypothetical protein H9881_00890, partial [Candidatus Stackebrandtia excrementipullorum]|nr:hypothetical protein [Candidatus Stackebrandtia excrementipullorum]
QHAQPVVGTVLAPRRVSSVVDHLVPTSVMRDTSSRWPYDTRPNPPRGLRDPGPTRLAAYDL